MKLGIVKTVTKALTKSKNTIVKHAPQIMAVAGAACFIGATVCAIKETPKAMEKLEEKKKLDQNMTTLQKAAVVAPEFKGTVSFTAIGLGLSFGAWKIEMDKVAKDLATAASIASAAFDGKKNYVEAAKKIVGEEKAQEIEDESKRQQGCVIAMPGQDLDPDLLTPDSHIVKPCKFNLTDRGFFKSREAIVEIMEDLTDELRDNGYITLDTIVTRLYGGSCPINVGYVVERSDGFGYSKADAEHVLRYRIDPWEDDFHRLGWHLQIIDEPVYLH